MKPPRGEPLAGRYRLGEELARGGTGVVYRATDLQGAAPVTVKLMRDALFASRHRQARFEREAQRLRQLAHPGILTVLDSGRTAEDRFYVVTRYVDGASLVDVLSAAAQRLGSPSPEGYRDVAWLRDVLGGEPASLRGASFTQVLVRWAVEIAEALEAAHQAGLRHGDVRPSHVLITRDGHARLIGFGLADLDQDDTRAVSVAPVGAAQRDPAYMAPELARGGGGPGSGAVDVYGLAATLYHMLALQPPFTGDRDAVYEALQRRDPRPLARCHPGCPTELVAVVETGMALDPERRYPSAGSMADDLLAVLELRPAAGRRLTVFDRAARHARRRPALAAVVVSGALLVLILGLGVPAWRAHAARGAARERAELLRGLPAMLALEFGPGIPPREEPATAAAVAARLQRLAELEAGAGVAAVTALLLAIDQKAEDRRTGALLRLVSTAAAAGDPFLAELLARTGSGDVPSSELGLASAPAPQHPAARALFALMALRDGGVAVLRRAQQVTDMPGTAAPEVVRDAAILVDLDLGLRSREPGERARDLQAAFDGALSLERDRGFVTPRTRYVVGRVHLAQDRPGDAIAALEQALQLLDGRHAVLLALGEAYLRLGEPEVAEDYQRRALAAQPASVAAGRGLVVALARQGRGEDAEHAADQMAGNPAWARPLLRAVAHVQNGLQAHAHGDAAVARGAGAAAQEWLQRAASKGAPAGKIGSVADLAAALATGDVERLVGVLLRDLALDPLDPALLVDASAALRGVTLKGDAVDRLREMLLVSASRVAPGRMQLAERIREVRAERTRGR